MSELQRLCDRKGLKADFQYGAATKPHADMPNNWRVTLTYQGRQLTTDFYGGSMVTNPEAADVVSSLILDGTCGDQSFKDFCADFGYDVDSRKAEQTWKACAAMTPKIKRLLGNDFETFANAEH